MCHTILALSLFSLSSTFRDLRFIRKPSQLFCFQTLLFKFEKIFPWLRKRISRLHFSAFIIMSLTNRTVEVIANYATSILSIPKCWLVQSSRISVPYSVEKNKSSPVYDKNVRSIEPREKCLEILSFNSFLFVNCCSIVCQIVLQLQGK